MRAVFHQPFAQSFLVIEVRACEHAADEVCCGENRIVRPAHIVLGHLHTVRHGADVPGIDVLRLGGIKGHVHTHGHTGLDDSEQSMLTIDQRAIGGNAKAWIFLH